MDIFEMLQQKGQVRSNIRITKMCTYLPRQSLCI